MFAGDAVPWLADTDVGAAYGFARGIVDAPTEAELRDASSIRSPSLVPADVLTWDRVEPATGAVDHQAFPAEAEPPGAFDAVVETAADHPILAAHAARRRPAMRLSELAEARPLTHSELYGHLLHAAGVEYEIAIGMRTERGDAVVVALGRTEREFSERDRDVLDIACPVLEDALRTTQARGRLVPRSPPTRGRAPPSCCSTATARSSSRAVTRTVGSPSTSTRPSIPAGSPDRSPSGSHCRRARRSSASATGAASPSGCSPVIRTRSCSRSRSPGSAPTRSTASA